MSSVRYRHSLRARVTLWYTVLLVGILAVYAVAVLAALRRVMWAELDDRLHHDIESVEGILQPYWTAEGPRVPAGASPLDDDDYRWCQVWSRDGRLLFESDIARARPLGLPPPTSDTAVSIDVPPHGQLRVKDEEGHIARHPVTVRVATSEGHLRREMSDMAVMMAAALVLCAAAAAYGGHRLGKRTLSPISRLVEAANQVTATTLSARLPVETPGDEVGELADAFNATLSRVEAAFAQMERFTANASHELRTPLTALQSTGQVVLTDATTPDEYRDAIGSMLEEAQHLAQLIETLLLLARSDAGQVPLARQQVGLLDLVRAVVAECGVLADEKDQRIAVDGPSADIVADPTVLRIALANVIHNAIRHTPIGGQIGIRLRTVSNGVNVEIEDNGSGIPPEHVEHIFERFYRLDVRPASASGGAGLGLSMARWAVSAHGGSIHVRSNEPEGSTFTIWLPTSVDMPESRMNV